MFSQSKQCSAGCLLDIDKPLNGHTVTEEFVIRRVGEDGIFFGGRLRPRRHFDLDVHRDNDLLHRLPYLDQLRSARPRMCFQLAPFCPVVRAVVVIDVTKQEARFALVNDQPEVTAYAHRPEVLVLGLVELVEAHAGIGRVDLQIESRRLNALLLIAGQASEAIRKRVSDAEFHRLRRAMHSGLIDCRQRIHLFWKLHN